MKRRNFLKYLGLGSAGAVAGVAAAKAITPAVAKAPIASNVHKGLLHQIKAGEYTVWTGSEGMKEFQEAIEEHMKDIRL